VTCEIKKTVAAGLRDIRWKIKILSIHMCFVPKAVETFWKRANGMASSFLILQRKAKHLSCQLQIPTTILNLPQVARYVE
jgi:hypothetical protein